MHLIKNGAVVALLVAVMLTMGCDNYRAKYEACQAELENLEPLFEGSQQSLQDCAASRDEMAAQLRNCQSQLAVAQQAPSQPDIGFQGEDARWDEQRGTITVTIESGVLFDSGKVTLKSAAQARLNRIAGEIRQRYPSKEVSIVGHTDTDPIRKSKWKDNWELSCQRALAVTRYLIDQGIPAAQLAAVGRGEYHPAGTKSASRRVEIVVHTY